MFRAKKLSVFLSFGGVCSPFSCAPEAVCDRRCRFSRLKKMACAACGGRWFASKLTGDIFYSLTIMRRARVHNAVVRLVRVHLLSCMRLLQHGCRYWGLPKDIQQMANACRKHYPEGVVMIHLNLKFCVLFAAGFPPRRLCVQCGIKMLRRRLAFGLAKLGDQIFSVQIGRKKTSLEFLMDMLMLHRPKLLV